MSFYYFRYAHRVPTQVCLLENAICSSALDLFRGEYRQSSYGEINLIPFLSHAHTQTLLPPVRGYLLGRKKR